MRRAKPTLAENRQESTLNDACTTRGRADRDDRLRSDHVGRSRRRDLTRLDEVNPDVNAVTVMLTAPLSEIKRIQGQVVQIVPTTVHAESSL
jgi:hypothetical protein